MHTVAYQELRKFLRTYDAPVSVVDVGSRDVNGSTRDLFSCPYTGVDIEPGPNVDLVLDACKEELPHAGMMISLFCFEHVVEFWKILDNMKRNLLPGGWLFIAVPAMQRIHRYPIDCYRFFPDAMRGFLDGYEEVSVHQDQSTDYLWSLFGYGRKQLRTAEEKERS